MWDDIRMGLGAGLFSDMLAHALGVIQGGPHVSAPEYFIAAQGIILGTLWARSLRKCAVNPSKD